MNRFFFITPKSRRVEIARVAGYLDRQPEDLVLKVEIAEVASQRSLEQNAYLWGVVYPTILPHLPGWDSQDLHDYFLEEHFGCEQLEGFGTTRTKALKRSSKLTKKEFREHWQFIQRKMAEIGIDIPDPNEKAHEQAA